MSPRGLCQGQNPLSADSFLSLLLLRRGLPELPRRRVGHREKTNSARGEREADRGHAAVGGGRHRPTEAALAQAWEHTGKSLLSDAVIYSGNRPYTAYTNVGAWTMHTGPSALPGGTRAARLHEAPARKGPADTSHLQGPRACGQRHPHQAATVMSLSPVKGVNEESHSSAGQKSLLSAVPLRSQDPRRRQRQPRAGSRAPPAPAQAWPIQGPHCRAGVCPTANGPQDAPSVGEGGTLKSVEGAALTSLPAHHVRYRALETMGQSSPASTAATPAQGIAGSQARWPVFVSLRPLSSRVPVPQRTSQLQKEGVHADPSPGVRPCAHLTGHKAGEACGVQTRRDDFSEPREELDSRTRSAQGHHAPALEASSRVCPQRPPAARYLMSGSRLSLTPDWLCSGASVTRPFPDPSLTRCVTMNFDFCYTMVTQASVT
ncbi:hypothetical protein H920_16379 [Fukomys damarensis]|uniref:Uncharacterized protein n=1 Tax=Fukomys damarensis TaxID=885580 RepID=A0A091CWN8_FUKDA|nr:hypothetical protein H920_16379 [Fukomys damarensis]